MSRLPDRLESLDVQCPSCAKMYRVEGRVQAVLTADGIELWRVCMCGYSWIENPIQIDLFQELHNA